MKRSDGPKENLGVARRQIRRLFFDIGEIRGHELVQAVHVEVVVPRHGILELELQIHGGGCVGQVHLKRLTRIGDLETLHGHPARGDTRKNLAIGWRERALNGIDPPREAQVRRLETGSPRRRSQHRELGPARSSVRLVVLVIIQGIAQSHGAFPRSLEQHRKTIRSPNRHQALRFDESEGIHSRSGPAATGGHQDLACRQIGDPTVGRTSDRGPDPVNARLKVDHPAVARRIDRQAGHDGGLIAGIRRGHRGLFQGDGHVIEIHRRSALGIRSGEPECRRRPLGDGHDTGRLGHQNVQAAEVVRVADLGPLPRDEVDLPRGIIGQAGGPRTADRRPHEIDARLEGGRIPNHGGQLLAEPGGDHTGNTVGEIVIVVIEDVDGRIAVGVAGLKDNVDRIARVHRDRGGWRGHLDG